METKGKTWRNYFVNTHFLVAGETIEGRMRAVVEGKPVEHNEAASGEESRGAERYSPSAIVKTCYILHIIFFISLNCILGITHVVMFSILFQ